MKPLIKRTPDGRRYTVPTPPRHNGAEAARPVAPQLMNGPASDLHAPCEGMGPPSRPVPPQEGRHMGRAKLTDDEVRVIRALYAEGKWTRGDIAYIYKVSVPTISKVVRRVSYTHVTAEPTPREQES